MKMGAQVNRKYFQGALKQKVNLDTRTSFVKNELKSDKKGHDNVTHVNYEHFFYWDNYDHPLVS